MKLRADFLQTPFILWMCLRSCESLVVALSFWPLCSFGFFLQPLLVSFNMPLQQWANVDVEMLAQHWWPRLSTLLARVTLWNMARSREALKLAETRLHWGLRGPAAAKTPKDNLTRCTKFARIPSNVCLQLSDGMLILFPGEELCLSRKVQEVFCVTQSRTMLWQVKLKSKASPAC